MMNRTILRAVAAISVVSACGPNGDAAKTTEDGERIVEVTMTDMAFSPTRVDAAPGETITFEFHNEGTVKHEAVFGDMDQQLAHHTEMQGSEQHGTEMHDAEMEGSHENMDMGTEPEGETPHGDMTEMHAVVVEPGETVQVTHVVETATIVGCHEKGHWEAGMKMEVTV